MSPKRLPIPNEIKNSIDLRKMGNAIQSGGSPLYNPTGSGSGIRTSIRIRENCPGAVGGVGGNGGFIAGQVFPSLTTCTYDMVITKVFGDNRVVVCGFNVGIGNSVVQCTLDGVAGTHLYTSPNTGEGPQTFYYWVDANLPPTAGTYTLITQILNGENYIWSGAVEFYGVNQLSPFGTIAQNTAQSLTVACVVGDMIVDYIATWEMDANTPGAGQTLQINPICGFYYHSLAMSTKPATGASEIMDWSEGDGEYQDPSHIAIPLKMLPSYGDVLTTLVVPCGSIVSSVGGEVEISLGGAGSDTDAIHVNVDDEIIGIAEKVVPDNADVIVIEDSSASYAKKRVQIGNLPGGGGPAGGGIFQSVADVSNPPTEAELIAALGTPDVNAGYGYVLNDGGVGANTYLVISDGGHYLVLPFARTYEAAPSLGSVTKTTICTGGAGSWYGRASIKVLSDGTVVLVYYHATGHDTNDGALHIRFSADYGATWTAEDIDLTSNPVSGFPMNPSGAGAGEDAGEPWLMIAPNGDLLLHMWCVDYGVTANGTYQSRSTDGGKTWSPSIQIDWITPVGDNLIFATDDDFIYGTDLYIGARVYLNATPTQCKSSLMKSTDSGITWDVVSDLSVMGATDTQEVGLEYVGGNRIVAILRALDDTKTYSTYSTDMGLTWAALTDITATLPNSGRHRIRTRAHLKLLANWWNDAVLVMNGFEQPSSGASTPRTNTVWVSLDRGVTWTALPVDTSAADGGYGDMFWDATNSKFVFISYKGTTSNSDLVQYSFPIVGI